MSEIDWQIQSIRLDIAAHAMTGFGGGRWQYSKNVVCPYFYLFFC